MTCGSLRLLPLQFKVEYAAQDRDANGVGWVHAEIGQRASTQVLASGHRSIGCIVEDAKVKRQTI